MKYILSLIFTSLLIASCDQSEPISPAKKDKALISYVNPFVGTGGHGHTYPGATMPFGMMQLSPDTRLDGWDGCSGYHYSDSYIYGFSHTHLSGTGVSDYGDILLMPSNKIEFNNGSDGRPGYRAHFSHNNELAEPGYYKVHLDSTEIDVELTVSKRSGMHRYTFPENSPQILIIDLDHRDEVLDSKIDTLSNSELSGYRHSKAWATQQMLFFNIQFSKPYKFLAQMEDERPGKGKKVVLEFESSSDNILEVKVGISAVDEDGAKLNLEEEIGSKSFEEVKELAQNTWEQQLEKIVVENEDKDQMHVFYTAMYHSMIAPNLYQDTDGRYRGMDLEIHQTKDFKYYTVFSLWDTYRAAHPLYTIIEQDRTVDFIKTFLAKYDEGGIMPIWDLSGCYTGCMIGYHAVPVIADAYLKGIKDYDANKALEAMKHSANQDHLGLKAYKKFGFIPVEEESESVSKTLEYAYDDWTIAQMALALNNKEDYKVYLERAQNYKNAFDPESGFMRGRFRNAWFSPFDPYEVNFNYTEANAWQYSLYVPQDISGYIELIGGKSVLENKLDDLFSAERKTSGRNQADITGLIGQYAHGNEPSHHMAYMYNFAGVPHKTQEKVHQIMTELYSNTPDGISGNEDCGQMSAWYIFSSLGFYPVTPGSNHYIIGTPLVDKASINLENGNIFSIQAYNRSDQNKYIERVLLNGKPLKRSAISHQDIVKGGYLEFYMSETPTNWMTNDENLPLTSIDDHNIIAAPFIRSGDLAFSESTSVTLGHIDNEALIYYCLDEAEFTEYREPITISNPGTLSVYAEKNGRKSSTIKTTFTEIDPLISIKLDTEFANQYNAGGNRALIDGITGTKDFRTGTWQGYHDRDVVATIDLGRLKTVKSVKVNFLEDQRSWIFLPTSVECLVSVDGNKFEPVKIFSTGPVEPRENTAINTFEFPIKTKQFRYIKIIATKLGVLPEWHLGYEHDGRSWIFIDEITID